jgi:hypothetical protein
MISEVTKYIPALSKRSDRWQRPRSKLPMHHVATRAEKVSVIEGVGVVRKRKMAECVNGMLVACGCDRRLRSDRR